MCCVEGVAASAPEKGKMTQRANGLPSSIATSAPPPHGSHPSTPIEARFATCLPLTGSSICPNDRLYWPRNTLLPRGHSFLEITIACRSRGMRYRHTTSCISSLAYLPGPWSSHIIAFTFSIYVCSRRTPLSGSLWVSLACTTDLPRDGMHAARLRTRSPGQSID